jgi:hypothetical protein
MHAEQPQLLNRVFARTLASYDAYRALCDAHGGLLRTGVLDSRQYEALLVDPGTTFVSIDHARLPLAALRGPSADVAEHSEALLPLDLVPPYLRPGLVGAGQFWLSEPQVRRILSSSQGQRLGADDVERMLTGRFDGELFAGHGAPRFTLLARYDMAAGDERRATPPGDITTRSGLLVTADRDRVRAALPALDAGLPAQLGSYHGLGSERIAAAMDRGELVVAVGFDQIFGAPCLFAIFCLGTHGFEAFPWINPSRLVSLRRDDEASNDAALVLPVVVGSKTDDIELFSETVAMAMREMLHRTQVQAADLFFAADRQSVLYTPRLLNTALAANGAVLRGCSVEATVALAM